MRACGLLAAVLLLIAVVAALSWINARRLSTANGLVVHTQEVARQLEAVNVALVSVESATRAYALTGDRAFATSARQFEDDARSRLSDVRGLTADNPTQQALVAELGQAVGEKVALNEEILAVRDRAGLTAAAALVGSGRGSQAMSRIRGIIGDMRGNEEHLLRTIVLGGILVGLLALAILAFARLAWNDARARRRATEETRLSEERFRLLLGAVRDYAILTTSREEEDILKTYDLGANSFISKPVGFESLIELVRTMTRYWFQLVELPAHA